MDGFSVAYFQFLAGGAGGLVRALVGIYKSYAVNPEAFKFDWKYCGISLVISMIVGQMSGLIFNSDWRSSLLAGYAGSDFLESLYKIKFTQFLK
ncbi:hypothetical protein HY440_00875 [Candidatus Microgenomates bacterium]|nr:hypothetical protein [Candidatus Microgenomates bacterium]